jgi:hypothetical protein
MGITIADSMIRSSGPRRETSAPLSGGGNGTPPTEPGPLPRWERETLPKAIEILKETEAWAAANPELAEDEWLGKIRKAIDGVLTSQLLSATLSVEGEEQ